MLRQDVLRVTPGKANHALGPRLMAAANPRLETGTGKTGLAAASTVAPDLLPTDLHLQGSHSIEHHHQETMDQLGGPLLLTAAWMT